jgi:ribosomal RNA-processing protein 8
MAKNRLRKIIKSNLHKELKKPNKALKQAPGKEVLKSSPLEGSRFRWLNESLYTEHGSTSFELFQNDPNLFSVYHSGFRSQTLSWPVNPVDECVEFIKSTLKPGSSIGDFGCGDAKIAQTVNSTLKVHSFDLVSTNPLVTACNIANVPLKDNALDMAVFSLSLMGTDWPKFIAEAQRCLYKGGILYIAEVQSRVVDFEAFKNSFKISFDVIKAENAKDQYFVKLVLRKKGNNALNQESGLLKPCLYKKR